MWQLFSQISIVYHWNDSGGHLSPQLIVSTVRTCDLPIVVWVILHWWFSSVLWSSPCKTSFLILHLLEEESDPSWMKQKAVKYHNPINPEVCWQVPPRGVPGMHMRIIRVGLKSALTWAAWVQELQVFNDRSKMDACLLPSPSQFFDNEPVRAGQRVSSS